MARKSAAEKWMIEQINYVKQIKRELSDLREIIEALPSTNDAKEKEEKQLERFRKKIKQKSEQDGRPPLLSTDEILFVGIMRDWKEFNDALTSLRDEISGIQNVLTEKLKE